MSSSGVVGAQGALSGRVVLVVGASSGIGRSVAVSVAGQGAAVALVGRREAALTSLRREIESQGGRAAVLPADVGDRAAVSDVGRTVAAELGEVSAVVVAAGIMLAEPFERQDPADWDEMLRTNLAGTVNVVSAALPGLRRAARAGGAADVVLFSSMAAVDVFPTFAVYGATKAAIAHFARGLRSEVHSEGVRVSVLSPGMTETELTSHMSPGSRAALEGMFEGIQVLSAQDVAEMVTFILSRPPHVNVPDVKIVPTRQP